MQNLYATQNQGIPFNPNVGISPLGMANFPNVSNTNDFNTMQNLFATGVQSLPPPIPSTNSTQNLATGNIPSFPNPSEFNTMQNLFATGVGMQGVPSSIPPVTTVTGVQPNPQNFPTASGFNTMQNLFATNSQGIPISAVNTVNPQPTSPEEFNTMQNLFATGNQGGITMAQLQSNPTILQNPTPSTPILASQGSNFNTMQNLFATSNNQIPKTLGTSQNSTDLQNINIQDFNTMQNLFKTGPGVALPPPTATSI